MTNGVKKRDSWSQQCSGNAGEHYVAYYLSHRLRLHVAMTSRNAKGVDLLVYNSKGRTLGVQVKTVRKPNAFGVGKGEQIAEWFVGVVLEPKSVDLPECYIFSRSDVEQIFKDQDKRRARRQLSTDPGRSRWIDPPDYRGKTEFKGRWDRLAEAIGNEE